MEIPAGTNGTVTIAADKQGFPGGAFDACAKCREELLGQFKTKPKGDVNLEELVSRCKTGDEEAIELFNSLSQIPWGADEADVQDGIVTGSQRAEDAEAGS
jgi:hypothetical protein